MLRQANLLYVLSSAALPALYTSAAGAAPNREIAKTCTVVTQEEVGKLGAPSVADALKALPTSAAPGSCIQGPPLRPFDRSILDAHNLERASVGAPPLKWDPVLQEHAMARAREIAQLRQLTHAPREGRGTERENILSAPIGYSAAQMMQLWTAEKRHFKAGLFPDVSDTGNWSDVAHYTQMVWSTTTSIGCDYAAGGGFDWLVCRYDPGGNKDGKPVIAQSNSQVSAGPVDGDHMRANGMATHAPYAPNPTVINLIGDGFIYGNIDLQSDADRINLEPGVGELPRTAGTDAGSPLSEVYGDTTIDAPTLPDAEVFAPNPPPKLEDPM